MKKLIDMTALAKALPDFISQFEIKPNEKQLITETGKLPLRIPNHYQLNTVEDNAQIIDPKARKIWSTIIKPNKVVYEFEGTAIIEKISFTDMEGDAKSLPFIIVGVTKDFKETTLLETNLSQYKVNKEFVINPAVTVKYLYFIHGDTIPADLTIYGTHQYTEKESYELPKVCLTEHLGVNLFEWDLLKELGLGINEEKFKKLTPYTAFRHYLDWHRIEDKKGEYTFDPTHSGSWNLDEMYSRLKKESAYIMVCLKTLPKWKQATYTANVEGKPRTRDEEFVPVDYGADLLKEESYKDYVDALVQLTIRYGKNKDTSKAKVFTKARWTADKVNEVKAGLNIVDAIEIENERDKWWKGIQGYQTATQYAVMLNYAYNSIKAIDPEMTVVMGGTAMARPDYLRGIIDWCKKNRGYKKDGTVDLCFDVVNYHNYANDGGVQFTSSRGSAPELSRVEKNAKDMLWTIWNYAGKMLPVINSEYGYDINQSSKQKAIIIGGKSIEEVQADWSIRHMLLNARTGLSRSYYYLLNDAGKAGDDRTYHSSGVREQLKQAFQKIKDHAKGYYFDRTISNNPMVDLYTDGKNGKMVIAYSPTESGLELETEIPTFGAKKAELVYLDVRENEIKEVVSDKLKLNLSEKPILVFLK